MSSAALGGAARLLTVYARRLHSNLVAALSPLCGRDEAHHVAEGAAALIDGLYIRRALDAARLDVAARWRWSKIT